MTYEIIARTQRDVRIGRLELGREVRVAGADYLVSRVLKVGLNESLVYLKPVKRPNRGTATRPRPSRH